MATAFARVTAIHDLISLAMTPCAGQLYRWLLRKVPAGKPQELELQDFADWSAEARNKPYSIRHVQRALQELIDSGIVEVLKRYTGKIFKIICTHPEASQRLDKNVENQTQKDQSEPQMSKIEASNPDSAVSTNREFRETTDTPTLNHPVSVDIKERINKEGIPNQLSLEIGSCIPEISDRTSVPSEDPICEAPEKQEIEPPTSGKEKIGDPKLKIEDPKKRDLEKPALEQVQSKYLDPELKREVERVIAPQPLNANLRKVIEEAEPEVVRNAIAVVIENQEKGNVRSPAGLLSRAIRNEWVPSHQPASLIPEGFSEWFNLAKEKGIVKACTEMSGQIMVCVNPMEADWKPWTELASAFTTSFLRNMEPIGPLDPLPNPC